MSINVAIDAAVERKSSVDFLVASQAASRLRDCDPTLWGQRAVPEATQRLGWVTAANEIALALDEAEDLQRSLESVPYSQILLCGMGGSSLSPQVMAHRSPVPLIAVDSVHPDFVDRVMSVEQLRKSIVIVSSKSGGTSETRTQLALCEARLSQAGLSAAERIVVITDPNSELEEHARLRGYRTVLGRPNVGGRYSALTVFGLVPSVLAGSDISGFADAVRHTVRELATNSPDNPAISIAAALHTAVIEGGTAQFLSPDLPGMPAWIEQLVAESTGKDGTGLLPIARDVGTATATGGIVIELTQEVQHSQRTNASHITVSAPLPVHFYFWEIVTSLLCVLLEVNPFDQPDVERTKRAARGMKPGEGLPAHTHEVAPGLEITAPLSNTCPETLQGFIAELLNAARTARYVVLQAFTPNPSAELTEIASMIETLSGAPTTVSYGPSYLHSTGQLHKGGQPGGLFVNLFQEPGVDMQVPGTITTFGWMCASAALADQQVLRGLGRQVVGARMANEKVLNPVVQHLHSLL